MRLRHRETTVAPAAIEVRGLRKTYPGDVEAVAAIDFDVAPGEVFGLLGPNGRRQLDRMAKGKAPDSRERATVAGALSSIDYAACCSGWAGAVVNGSDHASSWCPSIENRHS